jgi:hypothetical protein
MDHLDCAGIVLVCCLCRCLSRLEARNGLDVPIAGYVAMVVGVIASLAVGFSLMAPIFYSGRKGYDEPPVLIVPRNDFREFESPSKTPD